jgi:hypothetical protein
MQSNTNRQLQQISNPIGFDKAIQAINLQLSDLYWLSHIYGRAFKLPEKYEGRERFLPKAYFESGEYVKTVPNDNFTGMSFIMATSEERFNDGYANLDQQHDRDRNVSLICWVNLEAIDKSKDYVFTEELKTEVENILSNCENVTINSYIDEDYREVFSGLYISNNVYMMYPYAAFRFNLTIDYDGKRNC